MTWLKKLNAWLHLWLGIASGIIVFIISITGCILVFEQEIKSISSPWLFAEQPVGRVLLPPSILYQTVTAALPEKEIYSIWYHGPGRTAVFTINSDSMVYVNPYTAKLVAMVNHEDFFDFMTDGHRQLWLPADIGRQIVGWSTFIFFFLLISGIVLWWPKKWNKKSIRDQSFKIKWKAKFKRLNYDLHNVLGFYSLLVALLLAVTGLIISFSWFSKGVYQLTGGTSAARPPDAVSDTISSPVSITLNQVDKAWKKAVNEIAVSRPQDVILSFPKKASDAIYVCTDMYRGSWRDVYLDQYTLKVLPASQPQLQTVNFADWLRRSNYGLHVGLTGGLTTKIIYFTGSLICASLPVTGFYIWWGKKRKKTKKAL